MRVFFYLEDRERTLDTPTDKIMLSLTAFAEELEREKARQYVDGPGPVRRVRRLALCPQLALGHGVGSPVILRLPGVPTTRDPSLHQQDAGAHGTAQYAVAGVLGGSILQPAILVSAVRQAVARLRPDDNALAARRVALTAELATVQSELGRYAEAIASAGPVPALLTAIHTREQRREALERELAGLEGLARLSDVDEARLVEDLEAHLRMHWRGLLTKHVSVTRQLLRKLLTERVQIARHGAEAYVFSGKATVGRLLSGALPKVMVSPTGFEPVLPA